MDLEQPHEFTGCYTSRIGLALIPMPALILKPQCLWKKIVIL